MKVLVACEFSGRVRDAFLRRGHDAMSCDLLPSDSTTGCHYQGDVIDILYDEWDLLIGHPPCTYLSNSGVKHLYLDGKKANGPDEDRWVKMRAGAEFFLTLWNAPIKHIAIENPIMHGYAKEIVGDPQSQIIQPWQFGHGEVKATCLWLRNLPPLTPTNVVEGRTAKVHRMAPSPDRWKLRSTTYQGIADAMAEQWG